MCHFITAVASSSVDPGKLDETARRYRCRCIPCENPFVTKQLSPKERYFVMTAGVCDCGTVLGSRTVIDDRHSAMQLKLDSFQRKGWSAAKIERWKAQQDAIQDRQVRVAHQRDASAAMYAEGWVQLITAMLDEAHLDEFGLLLHTYRGSPESEGIDLSNQRRVCRAALSTDVILDFEEDVLHRFQPH